MGDRVEENFVNFYVFRDFIMFFFLGLLLLLLGLSVMGGSRGKMFFLRRVGRREVRDREIVRFYFRLGCGDLGV